jgi:hypothetical protein
VFVPIFHHSEPDSPAGDARQAPTAQGPDYEAALRYFTALSLPQRAAEVLRGIAPNLGSNYCGMDQLLNPWCPVSMTGLAADAPPRPDGWWALRPVLLEAFQALELARLVVRQEDSTNHWGTQTGYYLASDGRAALERGDVADVVARRLPV